jgi:hypothetical protein
MSWKCEVQADDTGSWVSNQLRFASINEAKKYSEDLAWRWTSVRKTRVTQDDDPVSAAWRDGRLIHLRSETNDEGTDAAHG